MYLKNIAFLISIAFIVVACKEKERKAGANEFLINGYFANAGQKYVYLEELQPRKLLRVDSVIVDEEGKFEFQRNIEEPGFYLVKISGENFLTLMVDRGETIELSGDAEKLGKTYRVKGSEGSVLLRDWYAFIRINKDKTDSLAKMLIGSQEKPNFLEIKTGLDSTYKSILIHVRKKAREFVDQHPKSLVSLLVLYQFFGNKALFDEKEDYAYFEKLDKSLMAAYPNSEHTKDLNRIVNGIKKELESIKIAEQKTAVGSPAPDIIMPSADSTMIALSSFKGKVVLIDFWASWCMPCRQQHPALVKLYNKFHHKGFDIYGVSLDKRFEPWIDAIQRDYLFWTNVCDFKYWKSPVVSLYNIEKIPSNVLVDRKGFIVAKNLSVDELYKIIPIYLPVKKDTLKP